ncbi:MAG: DUF2791 family P-loop domain-containing protein [Candidatus Methanoperedenaceae archaeon]|nr:DUF2791 family P-loop domain-containing protein [Candidatus Methanoperedenaceae archaeon]
MNNDNLIGKKIKHHRFGIGVIYWTRYSGAECFVVFDDNYENWVKKSEIQFISETEKTPLIKPEEIKPEEVKPEVISPQVKPEEVKPEVISPQIKPEDGILIAPKYKARRMIEAFRLGIVPFFDVEDFTFGRDVEIQKINDILNNFESNGGDFLFLEAEYGSGKTHFLDYSYYLALKNGYLVAKAQINAEDVPPYKPKQVYRELINSMRYLDRNGSVKYFRDFLRDISNFDCLQEHRFLKPAIEIIKNDDDSEEFYRWIEGDKISFRGLPLLKDFGTVADNYCYILSGIGNIVKSIGLKGFIILIDEGEKFFDSFGSSYKKNALNFLWALKYISTNEESLVDYISYYNKCGLFQSSTASKTPFLFKIPSNILLIMSFTDLSKHLKPDDKDHIIALSKLNDNDFGNLFKKLAAIYKEAYLFDINTEDEDMVFQKIISKNNDNIRMFIKSTVEALDLIRHYKNISLDELLEYETISTEVKAVDEEYIELMPEEKPIEPIPTLSTDEEKIKADQTSKMFCPKHKNISMGHLRIESSLPIVECPDCKQTLDITCDKFVLDTNILINRLFQDLSYTNFFLGKTIFIPETVVDEINNWKNNEEKIALYKTAIGEIKKIRSAYDQGKLNFKVIGKDASYLELIEKGRPDKIIAKDAQKENAIVITSDNDFYSINPDVSVIRYIYYPPKQNEIIEITVVGEKDGDGVGYYKNYTLFIVDAGEYWGEIIKVKIESVFSNKRVATANMMK